MLEMPWEEFSICFASAVQTASWQFPFESFLFTPLSISRQAVELKESVGTYIEGFRLQRTGHGFLLNH